MKKYDAIVILGSRPIDPSSWKLPSHIYASLEQAARLYERGQASYLIVSGKWTINFDVLHISQPFNECDAMADYLLKLGVPDDAILREARSKDTISNIYYLKQDILRARGLRRLHFIAAEPRLPRIMFLCRRILGPGYTISHQSVGYEPGEVSANEARTLRVQSEFLSPMKDGNDAWLDGKFFNDPFYDTVRARVVERAAHEPFLHHQDA